MRFIDLDNNATTPLLPAVLAAMTPYFLDKSGNPASSHRQGRQARKALEDAREHVAALLDCAPDEVIFTSGATEANNLALFGLVGDPPARLLTSAIEHPCVHEPLDRLAERGFSVHKLPVDRQGRVLFHADDLPPETRLVSIMLANHETGSIQPIAAIAGQVARRSLFHCDAAAAAGKIPVSFRQLDVDALTVSAHKIHGPKGIGALVLRRGCKLRPLLAGGHQQQGRRPGTEPVPLVVGFAKALELAVDNLESHRTRVLQLRACFLESLRTSASPVVLNGPESAGVPSTINLSFPGCRGDALLMALDLAGVACSTGSACSSGSLLPSPVLQAMGLEPQILHSALRFSLSSYLSEDDILEAARRVSACVQRARQQ